jgi:hypothetical protein
MYKITFLIDAIEDMENGGSWYEQRQFRRFAYEAKPITS